MNSTKIVLLVILLGLFAGYAGDALAVDPWRQSGGKYTVTTGVDFQSGQEGDYAFVDWKTSNYFRAKKFWVYNGTAGRLFIVRWKYDRQYDHSIIKTGSTRIYIDHYITTSNGWGGVEIPAGQAYYSDVPCDGFYFEKATVTGMFIYMEAMR